MFRITLCFIALVFCCSLPATAQSELKPYLLIDSQAGTLDGSAAATRAALADSEFRIVGEYSPYPGALVIAISHPELLQAAAQSEFGGYAAVLRLALTEVDGSVQRSYANPPYWGTALHVGELSPVRDALATLFGEARPFGSEKGLSEKKLARYRYMMMMPRLRDHDLLGSFESHQAALATLRRNLGDNSRGLTPVFEVAVPGTEEVLFGVGIAAGDGADAAVMAVTDRGELRHSPHLPYALLVSGRNVYALAGKYRIALAFPDLGMGTFMKISGAPGAIRDSLESLTASP